VLHCVALCCSTALALLHSCSLSAAHCDTLQHCSHILVFARSLAYSRNTLQHTATHCNTLQHTAAHCNTRQHTATHCNTLQHSATPLSCSRALLLSHSFSSHPRRVCVYTCEGVTVTGQEGKKKGKSFILDLSLSHPQCIHTHTQNYFLQRRQKHLSIRLRAILCVYVYV